MLGNNKIDKTTNNNLLNNNSINCPTLCNQSSNLINFGLLLNSKTDNNSNILNEVNFVLYFNKIFK